MLWSKQIETDLYHDVGSIHKKKRREQKSKNGCNSPPGIITVV